MFTGLVEELGAVESIEPIAEGIRLRVSAKQAAAGLEPGDSIAISGVCQTVVRVLGETGFEVIAIGETLRRTNFELLRAGAAVNLERPLRMGDRLGGHWVQGHVDGVGRVSEIRAQGNDHAVEITVARELSRFIVEKGSIAIDGVSMTVGRVADEAEQTRFWVYVIPETLERTLFGRYAAGWTVNLEVDILAKYILRAQDWQDTPAKGGR